MTATKALLHFGLILVIGLALSVVLHAQEPPPMPLVPGQATPMIDPETKWLAAQFGFAGMIFVIWWWDARKINKLTRLIENYERVVKDYEVLAKETRDTMLLTMQVNTRMVEKLEYVLAGHKEPRG